jgi:hypothetical protein
MVRRVAIENTQIPVPQVANTAAGSQLASVKLRTCEMSGHQQWTRQEEGNSPWNSTESRYEYDPEPAFSNDMSHERVIEILLFVLDRCTSQTVLECVEVAKLWSVGTGVVAYLSEESSRCDLLSA